MDTGTSPYAWHTFKKFASMLQAIAFANSVLPVPGGPYNNTPARMQPTGCWSAVLLQVVKFQQPLPEQCVHYNAYVQLPTSSCAHTFFSYSDHHPRPAACLPLGGLMPTRRNSSGFMRGSSMLSRNSRICSPKPPIEE
eukprot:1158731-Pelagomonas_calceolata.AAC.8